MAKLLAPLVPLLIVFLGFVPIVALVFWWRRNSQLHARQSPLTRNLLRPPGHSLRQKIEDFGAQIDLHVIGMILVPSLLYSFHITQSYIGGTPENGWRIGISILVALAFVVVVGKRLHRLLNERKLFALGLDGELATAEELNQLMLDGCRVFHDVPIRYGNVDHVVVSPSGVYAVNTKMLGKRPKNDGNAEVTVDHAKNIVQFPDRQYHIPVEKLMTEAKCLAGVLTSAVAEQVVVEPMLALPGWFIKERIGAGLCSSSIPSSRSSFSFNQTGNAFLPT